MKGIVHDYYDPAWEWIEDAGTVTARVTFNCGCCNGHRSGLDR